MSRIHAVQQLISRAALCLILCPGVVEAASLVASEPGFLGGFVDGLLAPLKLLITPLVSTTMLNADHSWLYQAGCCGGLLSFSGIAALLAAPGKATVAPDAHDSLFGHTSQNTSMEPPRLAARSSGSAPSAADQDLRQAAGGASGRVLKPTAA